MKIITGFHAIEEKIKSLEKNSKAILFYNKPGPRVKKIIAFAQSLCESKNALIECRQVEVHELEKLVSTLPELARDHRGVVLQLSGNQKDETNLVEFSDLKIHLKNRISSKTENQKSVVVILDSITDPHNVGAIIRSCDQFGADLVVLPSRRGASTDSEIIGRSSAGASSWVPYMVVPNLIRVIELLKEEGYWIYGADAGGENLNDLVVQKNDKVAIVMGSEGSGMSRIVRENCDKILSIPTCGKLDSLNVSVAAGILLYKISQN
ncbi:MAG: 23S rRNA (guanosine(2251)-2'-O)-methyltransferase RlmB [Treponemataceae bacterium]|nr:23S rRNA (guanosine(2251)-2'-O)-methyltransferase RlmB [Treponemataceae bacterium]